MTNWVEKKAIKFQVKYSPENVFLTLISIVFWITNICLLVGYCLILIK